MPQNKNFQKRITILDECFASRTGAYTLDKLADVILEQSGESVSRKTIQNDIKYIRVLIETANGNSIDFEKTPVFIPKLFDGKKTIFKYTDFDLALGNHLLSKSDEAQLAATLAILARYRDRADFHWLDELFPRIKAAFNLVHEDYNGLISYQSNRDYEGQSWVGMLYNQLLRKKVLHIRYQGFKDSESYVRTIHPYHLKQYNNRWFLFGFEQSEKYTGITNLALDRILNITETLEDIRDTTIDWGDFFDQMIGVSMPVDEELVSVTLRFSEKRMPYVTTKPIHGASQIPDKTDPEGRTIQITVLPNRELYQTLLSFGSDVEVLGPEKVVTAMRGISSEMYEQYQRK